MRVRTFLLPVALLASTSLLTQRATGQSSDDSARADKLFTQAMALVEQRNYAEACPMLEESERLDPALGTQYNLALCYEKVGLLGSAWRNLVAVERLAHASGKKAREEAAREKLAAMRSRVSHLVLAVTDADATLKVDSEVVEPADFAFYAVDGGAHQVDATAPAKKPWHTDVMVSGTEGAELLVSVPRLADTPGRIITVQKDTTNAKRVAGLVIGAVGLVGVTTAIVTGVMILRAKSTADADCTPVCKNQDGRDAVSLGKTLLPINAVAWGIGAAGLATGAVLLILSGKETPPETREPQAATLTPTAGPGFAGVTLAGKF
jgi:hypothetical protein